MVGIDTNVLVADCLAVERHDLAWEAYRDYAVGNADYADYLIVRINRDCHAAPTFTFDRKAARQDGFQLLNDENL